LNLPESVDIVGHSVIHPASETRKSLEIKPRVRNQSNLQFYWKTFDDQRVRFIDLKVVLVKAGSKLLTMAMGDQSQEDMGDQLK
jgi:hypothetical protein